MTEPEPERLVKCPGCGKSARWHSDNPHRPFCSARCKQIDLGAWASEHYRVPMTSVNDIEPPIPTDG